MKRSIKIRLPEVFFSAGAFASAYMLLSGLKGDHTALLVGGILFSLLIIVFLIFLFFNSRIIIISVRSQKHPAKTS